MRVQALLDPLCRKTVGVCSYLARRTNNDWLIERSCRLKTTSLQGTYFASSPPKCPEYLFVHIYENLLS